jgi:hypothetical protein
MTESGDKKPEAQGPEDPGSEKRSGRVGFDSRGNSVWEWQVKTGVYSTDVNTENLRKLDLNGLSLEDTAVRSLEEKPPPAEPPSKAHKAPPAAAPSTFDKTQAGGGFNPYDSATSRHTEGRNPYDRARALSGHVHRKAAAAAPKKPATDLRKLSKWIKLKRALLGKKGDDEG